MDKPFFDSILDRARDYAKRADIGDDVRVEITLGTGRTYVLDRVVETQDAYVQFDGWDTGEDERQVSVTLPYHQVSHVRIMKPKARSGAGFSVR